MHFSTLPFESTTSASTIVGWRPTSCTLRSESVSGTPGPTTTAVWVLTRASSWLVSWSMSSRTRWADANTLKKSLTTLRCAGGRAGERSTWSTK